MELERLKEEVGQLDERRRSLEMECEKGRGRVGGAEAELNKARDEIKLLQKQVHNQFIVWMPAFFLLSSVLRFVVQKVHWQLWKKWST